MNEPRFLRALLILSGLFSMAVGIACTNGYRVQAWERFQLSISIGWVVTAAVSGGAVAALGIFARDQTINARKALMSWAAIGAMLVAILLTAITYNFYDHEERRRMPLTPDISALKSSLK